MKKESCDKGNETMFFQILNATYYPILIATLIITLIQGTSILFYGFGLALISVLYILKRSIYKMRPDQTDPHSFPSGHSAFAWYIAGTVGQWNPLAIVWAGLISVSRTVLKKHDWIDVIAGILIGLIAVMLALIWQRKKTSDSPRIQ